jgi:general secretion pathway protein E
MGVEDYLVTSTLNAIVAQRLVRKLCTDCREPYRPLPEMAAEFGLEQTGELTFFRPRGCERCGGSGFFGRIGINEVLVLNEAVCRQVLSRAEAGTLQRTAVETGMRPMFQDGLNKVMAGITTVEEVLRVTREVE